MDLIVSLLHSMAEYHCYEQNCDRQFKTETALERHIYSDHSPIYTEQQYHDNRNSNYNTQDHMRLDTACDSRDIPMPDAHGIRNGTHIAPWIYHAL